jgi:hypothetical protein
MNQMYIQTDCGMMMKISLNFERSELGPVRKSWIIYERLARPINHKKAFLYLNALAMMMSPVQMMTKRKKDIISLKRNTEDSIMSHQSIYMMFLDDSSLHFMDA